jgi:hypothetical protein
MFRRTCWIAALAVLASSASAQTIYWKKDHVYAGPGGPEIAVITPTPTDTTAPTAPTAPTLSVPTTGYTYVDLSWTASTDSGGSGLAGYKVYRRIGSGANIPVGTVGSTTLTFRDEPVRPGVTYTYSIRAFDKAQNHSAASNTRNAQTSTDTVAPSVPASMAIAYTSPTSVSMTWTASTDTGGSGMAGYRIYRDCALLSQLTPNMTRMYVDTTLAANAAYTYSVRAVDNVGNESGDISRSVFRDDFTRSGGTGLNSPYWATYGSWTITSNQAYMPTGSSGGNDSLSSKTFGSFSASMNTVVRGIGSNTSTSSGLVFWSNDAGTEHYVVDAPGTPFGSGFALKYITPSQTYTLQTGNVFFAPYLLSVDADASTRVIKVSVNGSLKFTYTETDNTRRNSGRVGMRAVLASGENVKADNFIIVEKGGSLTSTDIVPPNVRLTYQSGTSVLVEWDASADIGNGVAGYEVFRGATKVSGANLVTGTSFQNTGLTANTAYDYTVKAVDNPGTRFASLTKSVFRDDFNRTRSLLSNAGWSTNNGNGWSLASNRAELTGGTATALTTASVGSFKATVTFGGNYASEYEAGTTEIVFWHNGTVGYSWGFNGLSYGGQLLFSEASVTDGTIRVEANAVTRVINIYVNGALTWTYVETDLSRNNSGKVGFAGTIGAAEGCTWELCPFITLTADDFILEEQ